MSVESETCEARQLLEQDLARPPLVGRVHVRVDEADRDRLDLARRAACGRRRAPSPRRAAAPPRRRSRRARRPRAGAAARTSGSGGSQRMSYSSARFAPPDLEHVAEAARRDERRVRAAARDHGVRRHGRAVEERRHLGRLDAERAHALDHADDRSAAASTAPSRRATRPSSLTREDVGERAPGVAADYPAHSAPPRRTPSAERHRPRHAGERNQPVAIGR